MGPAYGKCLLAINQVGMRRDYVHGRTTSLALVPFPTTALPYSGSGTRMFPGGVTTNAFTFTYGTGDHLAVSNQGSLIAFDAASATFGFCNCSVPPLSACNVLASFNLYSPIESLAISGEGAACLSL